MCIFLFFFLFLCILYQPVYVTKKHRSYEACHDNNRLSSYHIFQWQHDNYNLHDLICNPSRLLSISLLSLIQLSILSWLSLPPHCIYYQSTTKRIKNRSGSTCRPTSRPCPPASDLASILYGYISTADDVIYQQTSSYTFP